MGKPQPILNSKLKFEITPETVKRKRLYPLFKKIISHRITLVAAGAGYGKSTTMAQAVRYLAVPFIWIRLDRFDCQLDSFLSYLIAGIKKNVRAADMDMITPTIEDAMVEKDTEMVMRILLNELEQSLKTDIIIVLDDCHTVYASQTIQDTLICFLQNMSQNIHVIMIGRAESPWPLALFRARQEILDIREMDLSFSAAEVDTLFNVHLNVALSPKHIEILHSKTDGWISGLTLFHHILSRHNKDNIAQLAEKIDGSHDIIAAYLEEALYRDQSEEMKTFLTVASLLPRINITLCDRLTKSHSSAEKLQYLEKNHIFTYPADAAREEYYFHPLFQEFLQTKLHQTFQKEIVLNYSRVIATFLENTNDLEGALRYYIMADRWESACRLLKLVGFRYIFEGRRIQLGNCLNKIPNEYIKSDLILQLLYAYSLSLQSELLNAYTQFQNLFRKSKNKGDTTVELLCRKEIGVKYYETGDLNNAENSFTQILKHTQTDVFLSTQALYYLIIISAMLGKGKESRRYYRLGISASAHIGDERQRDIARIEFEIAESYRLYTFYEGSAALRTCKNVANRCQRKKLYRHQALCALLLANIYHSLNEDEKAIEIARNGIELQERIGFRDYNFARLTLQIGLSYMRLENIVSAELYLQDALQLFQAADCLIGQAEIYLSFYFMYLRSGETDKGMDYLELSIDTVAKCSVPMVEAMALSQMALVSLGIYPFENISLAQFEKTALLFKKALQLIKPFKRQHALISCLYAKWHWLQGKKTPAFNTIERYLNLLQDNYYDCRGLIWYLGWIVPILVDMYAKDKMISFITVIFKQLGTRHPTHTTLIEMQKDKKPKIRKAATDIMSHCTALPPPLLKIQFFNTFRLFRGETEVSYDSWKSKKALKLFKFLALSLNRGFLPKELLMEFLWPEEDPQKTHNRIHVTLNAFRKALEPNPLHRSMSASSYLIREGDAYRLDDDKIESIDITEFKNEIKAGKACVKPIQAITHYTKAETLYTGDFLENEPYEEWIFEIREQLKTEYLNLVTPILNYYEQRKDFKNCIEYAKRFLDKDKYNEDVYQRLLGYYYQTGNHQMVKATFEQCRESIEKELECPLDDQTIALYRRFGGRK